MKNKNKGNIKIKTQDIQISGSKTIVYNTVTTRYLININKTNDGEINNNIKTKRNINNKNIIVKIRFKKRVRGYIIDAEDNLALYPRENINIEQAFNRYTTTNNINIYNKKEKYFYLIRGNYHKLLDNQKLIKDLSLNSGDIIEVQSPDIDLNINLTRTQAPLNKFSKKIIIAIILISALVLILAGVLIYLFAFKRKKEEEAQYQKEDLVANINYNPNIIYRYQSNKRTNMKVEGENLSNDDSIPSIEQYIDFILMIRNKETEIENNIIQKNWYSGYIGILDITINNGTNNITILHDNNLNQYLKEKNNNLRNLESDNNIHGTDI